MLRAVSVWLGERGITPRSPKWVSMVWSEAVQRMEMASRVNIALPTRPFVSCFTLKGIPPPSCLVASPSFGNSVSSGPSVGNSGSSGAPFFVESTIFDNRSLRVWSSWLPVPKSAGIVEEIMLDLQLTKAFQTGLHHSLDDPYRDAMSDL